MPWIVWDNEYFDNIVSAGENFGLYRRGAGKWDPEELIDAYVEAAKTKMDDSWKIWR